MLEIILRNSIDRHMASQKGPTWLEDAVAPGGYLFDNPGCENTAHLVQKAIYSLGSRFSHDDLIPQLPFGFWKYQFAFKEYVASGSKLLNIFVNRPFTIKQKDIFHRLSIINKIRNRIAHYEPICFDGSQISTQRVENTYGIILELLQWLGCTEHKILYGIDGVRKTISTINNI